MKNAKIGVGGIGRLEAPIMNTIYGFKKEVTVREVYEKMRKIRKKKYLAYTTIMTVMNNLAEKGLLKQDKASTAYVYKTTKIKKVLVAELKKAVDVAFN